MELPKMSTRLVGRIAFVVSLFLGVGPGWADAIRVATDTVNLRRGPGTTAPVMATLARGEVLEVLERSGDWYRVRTASGVMGYVSARWVEPATAAAPPRAETSSRVDVPGPRAKIAPTGLAIAHKDVGCVVAGRHPRLEACLTPTEAVARVQVLFRADERGPWFSVDMKNEGACHSAVLPKPRKDLPRFHYFIEAVDRSFGMALQPGAAPDRSHAPRVVSRASDCGQGLLVAASNPNGSVVVNVARDTAGKALQAGTAPAGGTPASLSGFSMDGVTLPSAGSGAVAAAAGGGIGLGVVAAGAGVLAAGAAVAVFAGGGQAGPAGEGAANALTGRWSGTIDQGNGLTTTQTDASGTCTWRWDVVAELTQSGPALTGTHSRNSHSVVCTPTLGDTSFEEEGGASRAGPLSGSASGGTITFTVQGPFFDRFPSLTFTGTYSSSRIEATATVPDAMGTHRFTWRQVR